MHIRIRAKKYFLGLKKRVIGPWILISTLVFHMDATFRNKQICNNSPPLFSGILSLIRIRGVKLSAQNVAKARPTSFREVIC